MMHRDTRRPRVQTKTGTPQCGADDLPPGLHLVLLPALALLLNLLLLLQLLGDAGLAQGLPLAALIGLGVEGRLQGCVPPHAHHHLLPQLREGRGEIGDWYNSVMPTCLHNANQAVGCRTQEDPRVQTHAWRGPGAGSWALLAGTHSAGVGCPWTPRERLSRLQVSSFALSQPHTKVLTGIQKQRTLRNRPIQASCCKLATATLRKAHTCSFQWQDVEREEGQWVSECEGEHCGLRVRVYFITVPGTSLMVCWLGICLAMQDTQA